ncbi:hypothetical protein BCR39DRAFT_531119 [Naematelia encephala]|uniref:Ser-Thr-rich glycosyl-phosphatidyl-inositol-anchored membrane family-domain-containing protein n=1 Tax=Naematelia encephala TaxID=71784 RepID=A0A1Y2B4P8_9TREE|nr:hypothetical protein BCR39DRAFT_531119 [Naematelia encephala]
MVLIKALSALALAASALAQTTFSIATPAALIQCQPVQLSWTGGSSPFILDVIPGGQVGGSLIEEISSSISASPYTWTVNLAAQLNITLRLTDSTGTITYSSPLVIQAGGSTSCLNASAVTSGVSTGAVTTTGSAAASGAASSTLSATTSAAASSSTTAAASSAAASSAAASSAAASSAAASSAAATSAAATSAAATSAAATSSASSGAFATAVAGIPAIAAGVIAGVAMLF